MTYKASLFLALMLLMPSVAQAQSSPRSASGAADARAVGPWVELHAGTRIRLLGFSAPASPADSRVAAALELDLADGWKTYWRMPGDAGVPPTFDWQGSVNLGSLKVLYPAPQRLPEAGAETIGYKKHVLFPIVVTPKSAGPVSLQLDLELGVCKEICVPAQAKLSAELPVQGKAAPYPAAVTTALGQVPQPPRPGAPALVAKKAELTGAKPHLRLEARFPDPEGADLFIEAPESIYVPMAKRTGGRDVVTFEVTLSPSVAQDLRGKALTVTLVSAKGATEEIWRLP